MRILKHSLLIIFIIIIIFPQLHLFSSETAETGTLIVTYQTGPTGERLNRIRFWLRNEFHQQQMYPKGKAYVDDPEDMTRMVVIENLPLGEYALKFIMPNADGLFDEITTRKFTVKPGEVIKIDQEFQPHYANIKETTHRIEQPKVLQRNQELTFVYPTLIRDEKYTPPVEITPTGSLIVSYDTGSDLEILDQVMFKLRDNIGDVQIFPEENDKIEDPLGEGYLIYIQDLPTGKYTLDFYLKDDPYSLLTLPKREFFILENQTKTVRQSLEEYLTTPQEPPAIEEEETALADVPEIEEIPEIEPEIQSTCSLTVKNNITGARWVLYDDQEKVHLGSGTESDLQVAEGDRYKLRVEEFEGYKVHLEPSEIFSLHDEKTKEIKIIYERETGQVEFSACLPAGRVVSLNLIPEKNEKNLLSARLESKTGMVFWTSPPLPTGYYTVQYKTPENYQQIRPRKIKVISDQNIQLSPEFVQPRKLTVTSNNPNAIYHLRNENSDKVLKAQGRSFTFNGLSPGKYILSFSNKYPHRVISPKDMEILITKHRNGQVKVNYRWD